VRRSFGVSGIGSRRTELLSIVSSEIAIAEVPTGKDKGQRGLASAFGVLRIQNHMTTRLAKLRSPISRSLREIFWRTAVGVENSR
jgi:hypothetical protein